MSHAYWHGGPGPKGFGQFTDNLRQRDIAAIDLGRIRREVDATVDGHPRINEPPDVEMVDVSEETAIL